MPRPYDRTRRAATAADTHRRIVDTTEALLRSAPLGDLTLPRIAEGAGVTVQTVLRHLGSRDGCLAAVKDRVAARIDAQRAGSAPGDIDGALDGLLEHYETDGPLILALLAQSSHEPWARDAVERGRSYHHAWVLRCFGPQLPSPAPDDLVDALIAATDLYLWRLLRIDLGREPTQVRAVFVRLTRSLLEPR